MVAASDTLPVPSKLIAEATTSPVISKVLAVSNDVAMPLATVTVAIPFPPVVAVTLTLEPTKLTVVILSAVPTIEPSFLIVIPPKLPEAAVTFPQYGPLLSHKTTCPGDAPEAVINAVVFAED